MTCHDCHCVVKRYGKDRNGNQRYRCLGCVKTFIEVKERPLGTMRISWDKAIMILKMLVEGNSVRSVERLTGIHRDTILGGFGDGLFI